MYHKTVSPFLLLLLYHLASTDSLIVRLVNQISMPASVLAVDSLGYAYVGSQDSVRIVDCRNPSNLLRRGKWNTQYNRYPSARCFSIVTDGFYVRYSDYNAFFSVDVIDRSIPVKRDSCFDGGYTSYDMKHVRSQDGVKRAYTAFNILDVMALGSNAVLEWSIDGVGSWTGVDVYGDKVYVGGPDLRAIRISTQSQVGILTGNRHYTKLAVNSSNGQHLYVGGTPSGGYACIYKIGCCSRMCVL